jgi:hypothetical protein
MLIWSLTFQYYVILVLVINWMENIVANNFIKIIINVDITCQLRYKKIIKKLIGILSVEIAFFDQI